jgi:putative chitinase
MNETQGLTLGIPIGFIKPLNSCFNMYSMDTPKRRAAFLGQVLHESGHLKTLVENLNYGAKGLMATWPKRFPTTDIATQYERQPEKIANKVYADRLGNGPEESGDGWKYRGRGAIQVTGKSNYEACSKSLRVDLVANPELLEEPHYAIMSAGWFWNSRNLNKLADDWDIPAISRAVNGGTIGLQDRIEVSKKALDLINIGTTEDV